MMPNPYMQSWRQQPRNPHPQGYGPLQPPYPGYGQPAPPPPGQGRGLGPFPPPPGFGLGNRQMTLGGEQDAMGGVAPGMHGMSRAMYMQGWRIGRDGRWYAPGTLPQMPNYQIT